MQLLQLEIRIVLLRHVDADRKRTQRCDHDQLDERTDQCKAALSARRGVSKMSTSDRRLAAALAAHQDERKGVLAERHRARLTSTVKSVSGVTLMGRRVQPADKVSALLLHHEARGLCVSGPEGLYFVPQRGR